MANDTVFLITLVGSGSIIPTRAQWLWIIQQNHAQQRKNWILWNFRRVLGNQLVGSSFRPLTPEVL